MQHRWVRDALARVCKGQAIHISRRVAEGVIKELNQFYSTLIFEVRVCKYRPIQYVIVLVGEHE